MTIVDDDFADLDEHQVEATPAEPREAVAADRPDPAPEGPVRRAAVGAARVALLGCLVMVVWTVVVAPFAHVVTQRRLEADLRNGLNMATVPVRLPAANGTPLAFLEIDAIGVRRVVLAGTTADVLADGPGLLRTSSVPGQPGTSVIIGRRSLFGGDFADLDRLATGDRITVTTGQGESEYLVTTVRTLPSTATEAFVGPENGLLLMTSASAFSSADRLVVEAELVGDPRPSGGRVAQAAPRPGELGLDGDRGGLAALVAWSQVWLAALAATVWLSMRWRPRAAWVLAAPVHLALATVVVEQLALLVPAML